MLSLLLGLVVTGQISSQTSLGTDGKWLLGVSEEQAHPSFKSKHLGVDMCPTPLPHTVTDEARATPSPTDPTTTDQALPPPLL